MGNNKQNNGFGFDFDEIRIQEAGGDFSPSDLDAFLLDEEPTDTPEPSNTLESDEILDAIEETAEPIKEEEEILDDDILAISEEEAEQEESEEEGVSHIEQLVEDYYRLGIFTGEKEEEPITTEEQLYERFIEEKKKGANEFLTEFLSKKGQDYITAFQKIFVEGIHPRDYYQTVSEVQDFSNLDLDQEENQIRVVKQYYSEVLGFDSAKTERQVKIMKDAGELVSETTLAIDSLQKLAERKLAEKAEEERRKESIKQLTEQAYQTSVVTTLQNEVKNNLFKGLPTNNDTIETAKRSLLKPAWKYPDGRVATDFEKFCDDLKKPENAQTALLIEILRQNNFDLSSIQIEKQNTKTSKLFDALAAKETTIKRKNPVTNSAPNRKFF